VHLILVTDKMGRWREAYRDLGLSIAPLPGNFSDNALGNN